MSTPEYYIADYCTIRHHKVYRNGSCTYTAPSSMPLKEFTKGVYSTLEIQYPKFYKMDTLSKLGFLATEILVEKQQLPVETALVIANSAASLDTDRKHQASIVDPTNFYPSPATFVYTLPNIMLGEISIRHQLKSENAFWISEQFDAQWITSYAQLLLQSHKAEKIICGWVDLDTDKYDVFLALISKQGKHPFTAATLNKLYVEH